MPSDAADGSSSRSRSATWAAAIALFVVAVDQATKAWAVDRLAAGPIGLIGSTVELRLTHNEGSAFSLFAGFTPLLAAVVAVVIVVLVRMLRHAADPVVVVALSLLLGGAVGNLVDRLARAPGFLHGAVVDFVRVGWWPTFNVADAAVTSGAVLVAVWGLRSEQRDRRPHAGGPAGPHDG